MNFLDKNKIVDAFNILARQEFRQKISNNILDFNKKFQANYHVDNLYEIINLKA